MEKWFAESTLSSYPSLPELPLLSPSEVPHRQDTPSPLKCSLFQSHILSNVFFFFVGLWTLPVNWISKPQWEGICTWQSFAASLRLLLGAKLTHWRMTWEDCAFPDNSSVSMLSLYLLEYIWCDLRTSEAFKVACVHWEADGSKLHNAGGNIWMNWLETHDRKYEGQNGGMGM